eukprot:gene6760-8383_t
MKVAKTKSSTTTKKKKSSTSLKRKTVVRHNETKDIKGTSYDKFESPIGLIEFYSSDTALTHIFIDRKQQQQKEEGDDEDEKTTTKLKLKSNTITTQFKSELESYFKGELKVFKTKYDDSDVSDFMKEAWKHLLLVGYGTTASYKEVAISMGRANSPRAVATACRLNKFPLIVPCHRIVSVSGQVVGYLGKGGVPKQEFLYDLEKKFDIKKQDENENDNDDDDEEEQEDN